MEKARGMVAPLANSDLGCWTQGTFHNSTAAAIVEKRCQIGFADATGGAIVRVAARQRSRTQPTADSQGRHLESVGHLSDRKIRHWRSSLVRTRGYGRRPEDSRANRWNAWDVAAPNTVVG